jgi:trimethylamine--corrinoid protein Co-methyltransferase
MLDFYDPQSVLLNAACAEMMAYYGIPHAGTSGSGLGSAADLPSAGLHWLNHLTACIGLTGLAPFVGGSLNSKAFSPAVVVLANDIILQARRFAAGFALDETAAALDEMAAAGPGGSFLGTQSTRRHVREAYYTSSLFPRLSMEKWAELGRPQAAEMLKAHTLDLTATARPPADHDDLIARGEAYLHR